MTFRDIRLTAELESVPNIGLIQCQGYLNGRKTGRFYNPKRTSPTTINSGDMAGILMVAVQALEKRTAEVAARQSQVEELKAKHAYFETVAARLEALELKNHPIQITADKSLGNKMVDVMP